MGERGSAWQSEEARCAAVLREVLAWLGARELARCGAACRAWRRAAAEPALWRRVLQRAGTAPLALAALRDRSEGVCWREEAVRALAGWRAAARLAAPAALLHAALAPDEPPAPLTLALAAADASLSVWRREAREDEESEAWRELWRAELRERGWASVARAQWARCGRRLLLAGPLALADDWELLVLDVHEGGASVASRARCSAGAAGCWAGAGDAFLSLRLSRLAPALACTTVWLNAATQETQSEYAGVRAPLLRIFNENGEHITHALVADVPLDESHAAEADDEHEPGAAYHRAARPAPAGAAVQHALLAGGGRALGAWPLGALRPPPLLAGAGDELRERVRRRRERDAEPAPAPREPDEAAVRALCAPPERACRLAAPLVGLVVHDSGRCAWVTLGSGAAECRALGSLRLLRRVLPPAAAPAAPPAAAHYAQPDVSPRYFASPAGAYSSSVWTWSASAGGAAQRLPHGAPAAAALLPRRRRGRADTLLVLAGDQLHVWRSRATPQPQPRD